MPKEKNKSTETVPEKDWMANLLNKDLKKKTFVKMIKKLKEDLDKVKKIMYEQTGNISKENT